MSSDFYAKEGKVEVFTGDLGAGKTGLAVWRAFLHLLRGGIVFTNIKIFPDVVRERMAARGLRFDEARLCFLPTESLVDFEKAIKRGTFGCPVMVLLDESQFDYTPSEKTAWEARFVRFLALARKLHLYIVFICHNMAELKIGIRRKITVETVCRNLKEERIMGVPFSIPLYFTVSFKVLMGISRHRLESDWYYRLPAWGMYDSFALLGKEAKEYEALEVAEVAPLERIPQDNTLIYAGAAAFCGALVAGIVL